MNNSYINFSTHNIQRSLQQKLEHLKEWTNSAIDLNLAKLNVRSLSGTETYDHLLYALPNNERRNDGSFMHCQITNGAMTAD